MKKIFWIFIILILSVSCGKVSKETRNELQKSNKAKQEKTQKYNDQKQSLMSLQQSEKVKKDIINQKNLFVLNSQLKIYYLKNKNWPDIKQLPDLYKTIPPEIFSGKNSFTGHKDLNGGWYYDKSSHQVMANR